MKILIIILSLYSFSLNAKENYCQSLTDLIDSNIHDYNELDRLQGLCDNQIAKGLDAQVIRILSNLNLPLALQSAHEAQIKERSELLEKLKSVIQPYQTYDRGDIISQSDYIFEVQIKNLINIKFSLYSLKTMKFADYYDDVAKPKILKAKGLLLSDISKEAKQTIQTLIAQEKNFENSSNAIVDQIDANISKAISNALDIVSSYRTLAKYTGAESAKEDLLKGISIQVIALKATTSWGKFLITSKISSRLLKIDSLIAHGMTLTAKEELNLVNDQISIFLKNIPQQMTNSIKNLDSYKQVLSQVQERTDANNQLSNYEISLKQKSFLQFELDKMNTVSKECFKIHPAFIKRWDQFNSDYRNLNKITDKDDSKNSIINFGTESVLNRLSIFIDLCFGRMK